MGVCDCNVGGALYCFQSLSEIQNISSRLKEKKLFIYCYFWHWYIITSLTLTARLVKLSAHAGCGFRQWKDMELGFRVYYIEFLTSIPHFFRRNWMYKLLHWEYILLFECIQISVHFICFKFFQIYLLPLYANNCNRQTCISSNTTYFCETKLFKVEGA